jgi:hypothetical protein
VESQRRKITEKAVSLKEQGASVMPLDFPDPLEPYKTAFSQLLAPKALIEIDVKSQKIYY